MNALKKFRILIFPFVLLIIVGIFLFFERQGMNYSNVAGVAGDLPAGIIARKVPQSEYEKVCILLVDSTQEYNDTYENHIKDVFKDMRIGYDVVDVSKQRIPDISKYKTAVISFPALDVMGDDILKLTDWVAKGGGLMFLFTPDPTTNFQVISRMIGIMDGGINYAPAGGLKVVNNFLIGSKNFSYDWGEIYASSLDVQLSPNASIYMVTNDSNQLPILWKMPYGDGTFVVNNHGLCEKVTRGLTASAYSLLEKVSSYPIINSATFFLDDFPSPVPHGNSEYIEKFYHKSIKEFYANDWWKDIITIAEKYDMKYTGMVIEDYNENVAAPFASQQDTERFKFFGGMLLDSGGEIGLHGYNHMSLVLQSFDYKDKVHYKKWASTDEMKGSLKELIRFVEKVFRGIRPAVYVPPSNILSPEGRKMIHDFFPQIKVIAGVYLVEDIEYEQEFEIAEDGVVEFPRIISGAVIDDYMRWSQLNELTFHYVSSHFMHPDDTLDPERGAAMGWEKMKASFESYCAWLYKSAPNIRNTTGSEAGEAVQRYDILSVNRTITEDEYVLDIKGVFDEAYFMVRFNDGYPGKVSGGTLEKADMDDKTLGGFYILKATSARVSIEIER